jgi:hypothetical protein
MENINEAESNALIETEAAKVLLVIAKWAKVLAIIGFVTGVFIFVELLVFFFYFQERDISLLALTIVEPVVLYILSTYLFRFAKNAKSSLINNDKTLFIYSFDNLKLFFRATAIAVIVILIAEILLSSYLYFSV